jgi:hypothetical protein
VQHFVANMEKRESGIGACCCSSDTIPTLNPKILQQLRNRIYVISLPSHTTAALQLLDVAVFGPMKHTFRSILDAWKREHAMEKLRQGCNALDRA